MNRGFKKLGFVVPTWDCKKGCAVFLDCFKHR
jgi:hypothetical protein